MIRRFVLWLLRPFIKDPDIRDAMVMLPEEYTPEDQYRDFKAVFGTEEGRRVLTQILVWGRVSRPNYRKAIGPNEFFILEGQRNLALKILAAQTQIKPRIKGAEQRRKP